MELEVSKKKKTTTKKRKSKSLYIASDLETTRSQGSKGLAVLSGWEGWLLSHCDNSQSHQYIVLKQIERNLINFGEHRQWQMMAHCRQCVWMYRRWLQVIAKGCIADTPTQKCVYHGEATLPIAHCIWWNCIWCIYFKSDILLMKTVLFAMLANDITNSRVAMLWVG